VGIYGPGSRRSSFKLLYSVKVIPESPFDAIHFGCDDQAVHGRGPLSDLARPTTATKDTMSRVALASAVRGERVDAGRSSTFLLIRTVLPTRANSFR